MEPADNHSSFVEPSRIRVLVVPVGKWRRKEFVDAVNRLKQYSEIRLLDITPIDSSLFTPQGFPQGRLFFKFLTVGINDSMDLFLYDFEPFRKTFVVIGLVNDDSDAQHNIKILKEKYATVISHNMIYTTKTKGSGCSNVFYSPGMIEGLETIACDIGKNFLLALNHYYSSYKHMTLRSPGAIGGNSVLKTSLTVRASASTISFSAGNVASKRLSSMEVTTNNIKRSASLKISKTLTPSENRNQQRSQGRQLKILGNFQLLSGRYKDALQSFTEAVASLHKIKDYLWLGSALDGVAICFLMLSYLNMPFQIPQIVNVLCPTQTINGTTDMSSPRNSVNFTPLGSPRASSSSAVSMAVVDAQNVNLPLLVKAISEKVLYYYEMTLSDITDYAPQVVYSELLLKTLTFMVSFSNNTELSPDVLKSITEGKLPLHDKERHASIEPFFSKPEIYYFANKIFELQLKEMSIESQTRIYIVLAEIYGSLGFMRKKSFVLRLLMVALMSNSSQMCWNLDYKSLFSEILILYGVDPYCSSNVLPFSNSTKPTWLILQKRCLQLCLTVANKVGDNESAARFAVLLIKKYTHLLNRSEQQSLFEDFLKPLVEGGHIKEYMDPFMLREIKLIRLENGTYSAENDGIPVESKLTQSDKSNAPASQIDTHEVFNPFKEVKPTKDSDQATPNEMRNIFLEKDKGVITCVVQNPFKFEISIDEVQFNSSTLKFCALGKNNISAKTPFIVSPESIRMINLPMEIRSSTNHKWHTLSSLKFSVIGLPLQEFKIVPSENKSQNLQQDHKRYNTEKIEMKILPDQPELQFIQTKNMPDNSFMIMHGTKKRLFITFRNKSLSCSIDYLHFSHTTNVEKSMKPNYWKKLPLDDIYAMDKQLEWLKNSSVKIINAPSKIIPNETVTVELEVDAVSVPFQYNGFDLWIDYGMISGDKQCIYLKKLLLPFKVTLKRSIEIPNVELVPLNELPAPSVKSVDWINYIMEQRRMDKAFKVQDFILLLVDVRNSWLQGVIAEMEYGDFKGKSHLIEGSHTTRVIIPIKKLHPNETQFKNKPIPRLFQGRQYLSSGLNVEQENEMREKFWSREHVLSHLICNWKLSADTCINGTVDFSQFLDKFDSRMVAVLYHPTSFCRISVVIDKNKVAVGEQIEAKISVTPTTAATLDPHSRTKTKAKKNNVMKKANSNDLTMNIIIFDRSASKVLSKSNRRILYNGTLTQHISASEHTQANIELLPIEKGNYEITACISEPRDDELTIVQSQFEPVPFIVT